MVKVKTTDLVSRSASTEPDSDVLGNNGHIAIV